MESRDGYSRNDRLARLNTPGGFRMLDNDKTALLQQLLKIAGWIRFYNEKEIPEVYFDSLLGEIRKALEASGRKMAFDPEGKMEPSQALLLAFVENLQRVTQIYNDKWNKFSEWYLNDYLQVKPLPVKGDRLWLSFGKTAEESITVPEHTGFVLKAGDFDFIYRLADEVTVQNIEIAKVFSICFEKNPYHYPAEKLKYVTVIKTRDLLSEHPANRTLMFDDQQNSRENKAIGVRISSPTLLLREGERGVMICFESEDEAWYDELESSRDKLEEAAKNEQKSADVIGYKLFSNLFYLRISTPAGWEEVKGASVFREEEQQDENGHKIPYSKRKLYLHFFLPEDFAPTAACTQETHGITTAFPTLDIRLNFDAWLYAYSWIRLLTIQKLTIKTDVKNVGNVQVYNELGKIDTSKSFLPFGIRTGTGAWMGIGCYEMAVKHANFVSVNIKWGQLPTHPKGLQGYYAAYPGKIRNSSFSVSARYLSDNRWNVAAGGKLFRLFNDQSSKQEMTYYYDPPVAEEISFNEIPVGKMSPVTVGEEEYEYTLKSRSGFFRFTIETPEMGFGEQEYRDLFTERLMMKKWRRKRLPVLHPPINPVVENITLSYESTDIIDLRAKQLNNSTFIDQLYPFGAVPQSRLAGNKGVPFVFSQEGDASIMFGLKNVKGGETFSTFLVFETTVSQVLPGDVPAIVMYWGDGYNWELTPRGFIVKDETRNLLVSGNLVFHFPDQIPSWLYDDDGILWFRAAVLDNYENIPELKTVYGNAGQVILETENGSEEKWKSFRQATGKLVPERKVPGLGELKQLTSFYAGQELESQQNMQARVSEFVTHRGRAVTPRDFELLTLQEFPDIGKALCLPGVSIRGEAKNVVSVVVLPEHKMKTTGHLKPLVPSPMLTSITDFLKERASANVSVEVINPVYEELQVKCVVRLTKEAPIAFREAMMELFDNMIAPWQNKQSLPRFGQPVNISGMFRELENMEFVAAVDYFTVVHVSQKNNSSDGRKQFELDQHSSKEQVISPDEPYKLFYPGEHIINVIDPAGITYSYGISDMEIGNTFII